MRNTWKTVLRLTTPVGMGYLPTGVAFGVLATQAGLTPTMTIAMSVFIFAGALQFAAVPMLVAAAGLGTVALTSILINLRHVLYLVPLIDQLPARWLSRAYVVTALTDENYSVLTTVSEADRRRLFVKICLINHGYWILGTTLGVILGAEASRWIPNLDFALPALFTILAIEQYLARRRWLPAVVGVGAYLTARALAPDYALIASLAMGLAILTTSAAPQPPPTGAMPAELKS